MITPGLDFRFLCKKRLRKEKTRLELSGEGSRQSRRCGGGRTRGFGGISEPKNAMKKRGEKNLPWSLVRLTERKSSIKGPLKKEELKED